MSDLEVIKTSHPAPIFNQAGEPLGIAGKLSRGKTVLLNVFVLGLAQQGLLTSIPREKKKKKKGGICSVEEACTNRQCKWTRAHVTFQPSYLLGSTRGCPPFSHMWAQRHSCPEHYALQHLLMTKEGAVYTYFYSSIKRWPANKKKNQAHLVLCAECPQINRIRWAFSPHVKIRQKNWHWRCTLILRSWVLPNSNVVSSSWQLLASRCLEMAYWDGGVAEILFLWMAYSWNLHRKAGKGKGTAGRSHFPSPHPARAPKAMLSKCTDLTPGQTPCGATEGSDIFEDEALRSVKNIRSALHTYR